MPSAANPPGVAGSPVNTTVISATDPAANVDPSETVPAGQTWLLKAVSILLVQGITQTPRPMLVIDDGTDAGVVFQSYGMTSSVGVSTTTRFNWAVGLALSASVGVSPFCIATAPLPAGLVLPAGYRVRLITDGKGANTDYGPMNFNIVRYTG